MGAGTQVWKKRLWSKQERQAESCSWKGQDVAGPGSLLERSKDAVMGELRGIRKASYLFTWKPHFPTGPQTESLHSPTLGKSPQGYTFSSQTVHRWKLLVQAPSRLRAGDTIGIGALGS